MKPRDFKIYDTLILIFAIVIEIVLLSNYIHYFRIYDLFYISGVIDDDETYLDNYLSYKLLLAGTVSIMTSYIILIFNNFHQCNWKKQLLMFVGIALFAGTILTLIGAIRRTDRDTEDESFEDQFKIDLSLWFIHLALFFKGISHIYYSVKNQENVNSTNQMPQKISTNDQI